MDSVSAGSGAAAAKKPDFGLWSRSSRKHHACQYIHQTIPLAQIVFPFLHSLFLMVTLTTWARVIRYSQPIRRGA